MSKTKKKNYYRVDCQIIFTAAVNKKNFVLLPTVFAICSFCSLSKEQKEQMACTVNSIMDKLLSL